MDSGAQTRAEDAVLAKAIKASDAEAVIAALVSGAHSNEADDLSLLKVVLNTLGSNNQVVLEVCRAVTAIAGGIAGGASRAEKEGLLPDLCDMLEQDSAQPETRAVVMDALAAICARSSSAVKKAIQLGCVSKLVSALEPAQPASCKASGCRLIRATAVGSERCRVELVQEGVITRLGAILRAGADEETTEHAISAVDALARDDGIRELCFEGELLPATMAAAARHPDAESLQEMAARAVWAICCHQDLHKAAVVELGLTTFATALEAQSASVGVVCALCKLFGSLCTLEEGARHVMELGMPQRLCALTAGFQDERVNAAVCWMVGGIAVHACLKQACAGSCGEHLLSMLESSVYGSAEVSKAALSALQSMVSTCEPSPAVAVLAEGGAIRLAVHALCAHIFNEQVLEASMGLIGNLIKAAPACALEFASTDGMHPLARAMAQHSRSCSLVEAGCEAMMKILEAPCEHDLASLMVHAGCLEALRAAVQQHSTSLIEEEAFVALYRIAQHSEMHRQRALQEECQVAVAEAVEEQHRAEVSNTHAIALDELLSGAAEVEPRCLPRASQLEQIAKSSSDVQGVRSTLAGCWWRCCSLDVQFLPGLLVSCAEDASACALVGKAVEVVCVELDGTPSRQIQNQLVNAGVAAALTRIFVQHDSSVSALCSAAGALGALCQDHNQCALHLCGDLILVPRVLSTLRKYGREAHYAAASCSLLGHLARAGGDWVRGYLIREGLLPVLRAIMTFQAHHSVVARCAAQLASELLKDVNAAKAQLPVAPGNMSLAGLLETAANNHPRSARVQHAVLEGLWSISRVSSDDDKHVLWRMSAIAIETALGTHSRTPTVLGAGTGLLSSLSLGSSELREELAEHSVAEWAMWAMEAAPEELPVLRGGFALIANLCTSCKVRELLEELLTARAIPLVARTLRAGHGGTSVAYEACRLVMNACSDPDAQSAVIKLGVIDDMCTLLQSPKPALIEVVGTALSKLAFGNDVYREAVVEASRAPHVWEAMQAAQGPSQVHEQAKLANVEFTRYRDLHLASHSIVGVQEMDAAARTQGFQNLSDTHKPDWRPNTCTPVLELIERAPDGLGGKLVLESPVSLNQLDSQRKLMDWGELGSEFVTDLDVVH